MKSPVEDGLSWMTIKFKSIFDVGVESTVSETVTSKRPVPRSNATPWTVGMTLSAFSEKTTPSVRGIAFSPKGTIITSRFSGDLLAIPLNGQPRSLILEPFKAPADHRLLTLEDGSSILAVPEQDRTDPKPWKQNVKIIKIPKNF